MAYNLQQGAKNYKELSDTKLPRASRQSVKQINDDKLYGIDVIVDKNDQVKINYKYSSEYDEWRGKEDIVLPKAVDTVHMTMTISWCMRIKLSPYSRQDSGPPVRLEVPFIFQGGIDI